MGAQCRHPHAGRTDPDIRVHDFPRLVEHLHFLFRIAVVREHVHLRNQVERQLVSELLHCRFLARQDLPVLRVQLVHRRGARTAGSLVGRHMYPLDVRQLLDGFQRHHHQNRRAVRVRDDTPRTHERILRIDLRHHQRHLLVHPERAGIVDHHRSVLRDGLRILPGGVPSCRDKGEVDALEIVVMLQQFHRQFLPSESVRLSRAAR